MPRGLGVLDALADKLSLPPLLRPDSAKNVDWDSLVADLSRGEHGSSPVWRVHDKTHLEFAVDYMLTGQARRHDFEWDAYFFVPESLRLHDQSYGKQEIYDDLQSYVRFAVPRVQFAQLTDEPMTALRAAVASGSPDLASREMRLFACFVRAAGLEAKRAVVDLLDKGDAAAVAEAAAGLAVTAVALTQTLRRELAPAARREDLVETVRWIDEDVSRATETLLATLVLDLRGAGAPETAVSSVAAAASAEAKYRRDHGLDGVGHAAATTREVEHLEFRRHVLKRFTSSVLWLSLEVRQAGRWVAHVLNSIAAGIAMAFALSAALFHGTQASGSLWKWALAVVLAYAAKDRIKVLLQGVFSSVILRHFPDRTWRILDRERRVELGHVLEQSGFVPRSALPAAVLAVRGLTRQSSIDEESRPERVIWHHKACVVHSDKVHRADPRFQALTEIFRLNLRRWLDHTDDPKRNIVFADPNDGNIYSAVAPRVYNIAIVYRLRRARGGDEPWHRTRVVVTRKGIQRVDHVC